MARPTKMTPEVLAKLEHAFKIGLTDAEACAYVGIDPSNFYRYQEKHGIAFDDETNPLILMSDDLADIINTQIYLADTFEELERYDGYLDGIERMLVMTRHQVVA